MSGGARNSAAGGSVPVFAVVGRVNKGKSSVVASLIEDDSVKISPRPGTTTECVHYDVSADGELLFRVIDTPGFEDAPRALHWLKQRETSAADRPRRVKELVETFAGSDEFVEECRLLRPVLEGACVLYVVSADEPYRPNYEAEMEILRWTGRPAMALINRTSSAEFLDDWRRALDQFFKLVREFDAHTVTFRDRVKLLELWKTLEPGWEGPLAVALEGLEQERRRRRYEIAGIVTDLLCESLTYHATVEIRPEELLEVAKRRLEKQFHDRLRKLEAKAHRRIAEVYLHRLDGWTPESAAEIATGDDLFAEETWDVMGLPPTTLLTLAALGGATTGGTIDALVGGASFGAGAVIGGLAGFGAGAYKLTRRFASADQLMKSLVNTGPRGPRLRVGPHPSENFPFVLVGRALHHFDRVRAWAHAVSDLPEATGDSRLLEQALDARTRRNLARLFAAIRKRYDAVPAETRSELHRELRALFDIYVERESSGG